MGQANNGDRETSDLTAFPQRDSDPENRVGTSSPSVPAVQTGLPADPAFSAEPNGNTFPVYKTESTSPPPPPPLSDLLSISANQLPLPHSRLEKFLVATGCALTMLLCMVITLITVNAVNLIGPNLIQAYQDRENSTSEVDDISSSSADPETPVAGDSNMAEHYLDLGNSFAQKGLTATAIRYYDQAIQLDPTNAEAYKLRADAHLTRYAIEHAITDFTQAIELNPDYAEAYFGRGNAYMNKGDWYGAIRNYDSAIGLTPDFAEAYYQRGIAYANLYQTDNAVKDFNKTIELCGASSLCQDAQNWLNTLALRI